MIRKSVFVSEKILEKLQAICDKDGVTFSDLVRRSIAEFLDRQERLEGRKDERV